VKVVWLTSAFHFVMVEAAWLASDVTAATHFRHRIVAAVRSLSMCPVAGRPGQVPGTRELAVDGYLIVYRLRGLRVEILRVFRMSPNWPGSLH
jgi:plasmid stabilization system protein ParE